MSNTTTKKCSHCDNVLPTNHNGNCPVCEKIGTNIAATFNDDSLVMMDFTAWEKLKRDKNFSGVWSTFYVIVMLLSSFIGYLVPKNINENQAVTTILSLVCNIICIYLGYQALVVIIEKERGTAS